MTPARDFTKSLLRGSPRARPENAVTAPNYIAHIIKPPLSNWVGVYFSPNSRQNGVGGEQVVNRELSSAPSHSGAGHGGKGAKDGEGAVARCWCLTTHYIETSRRPRVY